MKIKILYFLLILLFISFSLFSNKNDILIQEKTQEDEWDIFNEPEEEQDPVITNQLFSALVNIKAEAGLKNNSLFTQLNVDPLFNVSRFFLEADLKYKITFFNLLKFESDYGIYTSNKNIIQTEQGEPENTALYHIGINNLFLEYTINNNLFVSAGFKRIQCGNSLYFNPVNYFEKFTTDPSIPGQSSFPVVELAIPYWSNWFIFQFIPVLYDKTDNNETLEFFQDTYKGNLARILSSHYFFDLLLELNIFLEEKKAYTFDNYYWGIGLETILPLTDFLIFQLQFLTSTGKDHYITEPFDGFEEFSYLTPENESRDKISYDVLITTKVTLFKFFNVNPGYIYRESGLGREDWDSIASTLFALINQPEDFILRESILTSFKGLRYSPLAFLKHLLFLSLEFPFITEQLSINLLTLVSPVDFSLQVYLNLLFNVTEKTAFYMEGNFIWGNTGSAFNLMDEKMSIALGLEINY